MMQLRIDISNFLQRIGESFAQAYERFNQLINFVPNHGFAKFTIVQFSYSGLNNENKQTIDSCIGGSRSNLMLEKCEELFATRAFNDEQYNPSDKVKEVNGIIHIPKDLIPEVAKSMKEKGQSTEFTGKDKVNVFQGLVEEYELEDSIAHFKEQQAMFREAMNKHFRIQRRNLSNLTKSFEELSHYLGI
jgi:hypothetical protein